MVKKKKTDVSVKVQLAIATGIVLLLVAFGLVVKWLDSNHSVSVTKKPAYSDITIKGESTCLPHRGDGAQTMECAQGVKTASGAYYAIEGVVDRNDNDNTIEITGTLKPVKSNSKYDIQGIILIK